MKTSSDLKWETKTYKLKVSILTVTFRLSLNET